MLYDNPVQWVHKLKYLGCFFNHSCSVDYCDSVQKFYGNYSAAALLAMHSAVITTAIPSVCLSICPSVRHMLVPYPDE